MCFSCETIVDVQLLKLARPVFEPALYNDLGLGIELNGVLALSVEGAKEAGLPSAEGEECHRGSHADIDADVAGQGFFAELPQAGQDNI